jgi:hypothetical protein
MLRKRRKPITIPSPLGLAFIPVLLILAGLSIPAGLIQRQLARRRRKQLLSDMRLRGRVVVFSEIEEQANCGSGTLIIERRLPKGPVRHWWTPEDIYVRCPYPLGSSINPFESSPFGDAISWCRERYTDVQKGAAALVADPAIPALASKTSRDLRWFEIPFKGR